MARIKIIEKSAHILNIPLKTEKNGQRISLDPGKVVMNLKKVKQLAAATLSVVLPLEYMLKVSRNRYVLAYHRVLPPEVARQFNMQESMWISADTFSDDITWMRSHGDIVDLETILDFSAPNKRPMFSITFDDGWGDNYKYAFPILKKHNIPATIFLVTHAIETGRLFWVEDFLYKVAQLLERKPGSTINDILLRHYSKAGIKLEKSTDTKRLAEGFAELLKPFSQGERDALLNDLYRDLEIDPEPLCDQILKWSDIVDMSEHGIEFGSHTHTHEILQYADNAVVERELELSRDIIAEKTGKPVRYFCYPNARYRDENADLIKQAGYEYAFRIHNLCLDENQNKFFVPRYIMNEMSSRNKNYLLCKLLNFPKF